MSYQGFLIREIYQDNRDFYRGQLDLNRESVMLREIARQNLALQEKFEPGIEHTRLVSHVINIFEVKDVNWRKKGDLVIPKGNLEQLLSLDLGHQIKIICDEDQEFKEEELGNLTIALPDGTYLVGTQVKRSKYFGSQDKKILPNDFLDVRFNPKDYKEKNPQYSKILIVNYSF